MDYYTILAQRKILSDKLTGTIIESARITDNRSLFLGFDRDYALKLACIPDMPYLHELEKRYLPVKTSQDWFSKRLQGQEIKKVGIIVHDRIMKFIFESGTEIIFEMTGRNTNIVLVDESGIIIGAMRTVTGKESAFRTIKTGAKYIYPPERFFPDLQNTPFDDMKSILNRQTGTIGNALPSSFCCGSRLFAAESLTRAGISPDKPVSDLSGDETLNLFEIMHSLEKKIAEGGDGAIVIFDRDSIPENVFPLKIEPADKTILVFDSLNEAMIKYARTREVELEKRGLKNSVLGYFAREEKKILATIKKVESEAGDEDETEKLERMGNTILANIHRIKKGTREISLPDIYGSGEEIEFTFDPSLDAAANAARFFTRARKLRAASKLAVERLGSLKNRLENIISERENVLPVNELSKLRELSARYARYQGQSREITMEEKFPRRFHSVSGLEIIVGRSDEENDELVRWASKNDYWLHAQGVGGSHVILRSPGRQTPDHRSIEQAAAIAAYFSKAKTSAVVPVAVTLVKYVVKRKGQGPGKVTYTREKVIFTEPGIPSGETNNGG